MPIHVRRSSTHSLSQTAGQTATVYVDVLTPDTIDVDSPDGNNNHLRPITPQAATLVGLVNNIPALRCLLHGMSYSAHKIQQDLR